MRLTDLEPEWVADYQPADRSHKRGADLTVTAAQGILFECPLCRNHSILVWFAGRGVPDDAEPGAAYAPGRGEPGLPGYAAPEHPEHPQGRRAQRWAAAGSGFADLTLTPSIALQGGCAWHGFITNGGATNA